jgi:predicted negative regulator of RcsB-dependent stress response
MEECGRDVTLRCSRKRNVTPAATSQHIISHDRRTGTTVDQYTKRKLKEQDQFLTVTEHGIEWANQNRRSAITTAAVLLLFILAIVGVSSWRAHRDAAAATAFGAAMQTYNTPVASAARPATPGEKSFPTVQARAVESNKQFAQVAEKYSTEADGKLARYYAGLTAMEAGQNQSAEDSLKKVAGGWNGNMSALANLALAQLYRSEGRNDDAIALYKKLADGHSATVPPGLAQIELAELYEATGRTTDARTIYAKLQDKDKDAKGKEGPIGALAAEKLNPAPAAPAGAPGAQ